jgi:hypothetical protein
MVEGESRKADRFRVRGITQELGSASAKRAWDLGQGGDCSTAQAEAFAGANAEEKVGLLRSQ